MDTASQVGTKAGGGYYGHHSRHRRRCSYLGRLLTILTWITLLLLHCSPTGGAEFHLAGPKDGCTSLTTLHSTVDLVCQYFDRNDQSSAARRSREQSGGSSASTSSSSGPKEPTCSVVGLQWQRLAVGRSYNISDSDKFGVWTAIPGWGMRKSEHVSLLRVRQVKPEDIGTYKCLIQCAEFNKNGHRQVLERSAQVALAQPNSNYAIHGIHLSDGFCTRSFRDGVCQLECDEERHLYDGFDCSTSLPICPEDNECKPKFHNGFCDEDCNTKECGWDGGDCIASKLKLSDDTVVLFLARRQASVSIHLKALGRALTFLLQTIVRVYSSSWNGPHNEPRYRDSYYTLHDGQRPKVPKEPLDQVLYLKIDNTRCKSNCFRKAERTAHFIALALQKGWDPGISITTVTVLSKLQSNEECLVENSTRLDINLAEVDRGHQQQEDAGFMSMGLQPWVLVAAVASGLALLLLIITLTLVMCRMLTSRHKRCRRDSFDLYDSTARIRSEKSPPGTDV